jgi:hypothetical protein
MPEYPKYVAIRRSNGVMSVSAELAQLGQTGGGRQVYDVIATGNVMNIVTMADELNAGVEVLKEKENPDA